MRLCTPGVLRFLAPAGERIARGSGSRSLTGYEPARESEREGGQRLRRPERPQSLRPPKGMIARRSHREGGAPAQRKNEGEG